MFAVVEFLPEPCAPAPETRAVRRVLGGWFGRGRRRVQPPGAVRVSRRETGSAFFYILSVVGKPDWGALKSAAGAEAARLLLPRGLSPPPECGIIPYDAAPFLRGLLWRGAITALSTGEPDGRQIGFFDPEGLAPGAAMDLLPLAGTVRVVTNRPQVYRPYRRRAMERYGADFVVSHGPDSFVEVSALVAPFGLSGCPCIAPGALVFANDPAGWAVTDDCVTLPPPYDDARPPGIPAAVFAAALYERGYVRAMGDLLPDYLVKNGERHSLRQLAAIPEHKAVIHP